MKKIISTIMSIIMLLSMSAFSAFADDNITVKLNGQNLHFEVQPQIINDRTMVPMRAIFEALGYEVTWYEYNQSIMAWNPFTKQVLGLSINLDQMLSYFNDEITTTTNTTEFAKAHSKKLDVAPLLINGFTFVPIRAISEASGADVLWDNDTKTVKITATLPQVYSKENPVYYDEQPKLYSFANIIGTPEVKKTINQATKLTAYTYYVPTTKNIYTLCLEYCDILSTFGYNLESASDDRRIYINMTNNIIISITCDEKSRCIIIIFGNLMA